MTKNGVLQLISSWLKLTWGYTSRPISSVSHFVLKEARKPVAFGMLLAVSMYFLLEIYLFLLVDSSPPGVHLPIFTNLSNSVCRSSPFCTITAKSLFLGPLDFYIQKPLTSMLNRAVHVDVFVSANFVSFTHIVAALLSAKLIVNESLLIRRIGVFVYLLRNFLDSLDGVVAKEEHKRRGELHLINQPAGAVGYFIDGICDGVGCILLLSACLIYMQRHAFPRKLQQIAYTPLSTVSITNCGAPLCVSPNSAQKKRVRWEDGGDSRSAAQINPGLGSPSNSWLISCLSSLSVTRAGIPAILYLVQLLWSSLFWNRNIIMYGRLLEPNHSDSIITEGSGNNNFDAATASQVIHSTFMWVIIFSWRICNPMFMTELLLFFVFLDKMHEFLNFFQYYGFFIISCIAAISEAHRAGIHRIDNNIRT